MKRIKEIADQLQLSLSQVAGRANATEDRINRWIAGTEQPTTRELRDLAIGLNSTKAELREDDESYPAASSCYPPAEDRILGDWGHIGLHLPGEQHSRWYPINGVAAGFVEGMLDDDMAESPWIYLPTTSSRLLFINTKECLSISLLHRSSDTPLDDWEPTMVQAEVNSEWASAIAEHLMGHVEDSSEWLRSKLSSTVKDPAAYSHLMNTTVHYVNGQKKRVNPSSAALHACYESVLSDLENNFYFDLSNDHQAEKLNIPSRKVCLLDAPLHLYENLNAHPLG